jgi:hypothetical protein
MKSNTRWQRIRLLLSPQLLSISFALLNLALVAVSFQSTMPSSERWG